MQELAHVQSKTIDDFLNKIICGRCEEVMKDIPDESVDLIVTSPPYNLKNSTGNGMKDGRGGKWSKAALINGYDNYNDNMPYDEYIAWQRECLAEMYRIIKDDVTPYWNLEEIYAKLKIKLKNCFFVLVEEKREGGQRFFHFYKAYMLKNIKIENFISVFKEGNIVFEFDARTGHNHGTKCRIGESFIPSLFESTTIVLDGHALR
jgi:hypothetical protein